ncbi:esterase/lipase family protein [Undibacterium sp. Ji22W]|uniref:esterase/lipase family protein n=1 Tax=Undibacterium sp. Ji22W TaxID=3413038 RepID=UPI003BEF7F68
MQIVFIDGVGGKTYMRGGLVRFFTKLGYAVACFDYSASTQSLAEIKDRLRRFLDEIAARGDYLAIGYSFGGVLIRQILQESDEDFRQPARLVLLASPVRAVRLSLRMSSWQIFKRLAGECGQVTADPLMMDRIPMPAIPTACIYGVWPWLGPLGFFAGFKFSHDGMLAVEEVLAPSAEISIPIQASHALIPGNLAALKAMQSWFNSPAITKATLAR